MIAGIASTVLGTAAGSGVSSLIIGMFFLASVQIFCLGLIGEYVGLIFDHARNRPLVIEKERVNF